jgi:hypothetical protein
MCEPLSRQEGSFRPDEWSESGVTAEAVDPKWSVSLEVLLLVCQEYSRQRHAGFEAERAIDCGINRCFVSGSQRIDGLETGGRQLEEVAFEILLRKEHFSGGYIAKVLEFSVWIGLCLFGA